MVQREREARGTRRSGTLTYGPRAASGTASPNARGPPSAAARPGVRQCSRPQCGELCRWRPHAACPRSDVAHLLARARCTMGPAGECAPRLVQQGLGVGVALIVAAADHEWNAAWACERGLGVRAQRSTCACGPAAAVPRSMIEPTTSVSCSCAASSDSASGATLPASEMVMSLGQRKAARVSTAAVCRSEAATHRARSTPNSMLTTVPILAMNLSHTQPVRQRKPPVAGRLVFERCASQQPSEPRRRDVRAHGLGPSRGTDAAAVAPHALVVPEPYQHHRAIEPWLHDRSEARVVSHREHRAAAAAA